MCDRFRYGVFVGKINEFVRVLFLCQILFYSALFLSTHCRCRGLLLRLTILTKAHTHTHTHTHTLGRTSLDEGLARGTDLYLKAHNILNEQNIHASGGIRSRNPSKRVGADPRLRQREHWDRPVLS